MYNVSNENNHSDDSFTTEMQAQAGFEFLWAGLILAISFYHQLSIGAVFTAFVAKGFTNIA
jgi:hypothetical protein